MDLALYERWLVFVLHTLATSSCVGRSRYGKYQKKGLPASTKQISSKTSPSQHAQDEKKCVNFFPIAATISKIRLQMANRRRDC